MIVVVTTKYEGVFKQCVTVNTLKRVLTLCDQGDISVLVINSFEEDSFNAGLIISDIRSKCMAKVLYISDSPDPITSMTIRGIQGEVYDSEFYLEDEGELLALLEEVGLSNSSNALALESSNNVSVIKDFIGAFTRGEKKINYPAYLNQVTTALNKLEQETKQTQLQLNEMGDTAISVFKKAAGIITSMHKQQQDIQAKLDELESAPQVSQSAQPSLGGGGISLYPSVTLTGSNNILLIREYSFCRYLTSFVLAYANYLKYTCNKRVRVIFCIQKGYGIKEKYNSMTCISQESLPMLDSLKGNEIIATNHPLAQVMKTLTSVPADVTIVVDRLYNRTDIVSGRVKKVCAVNGYSDIARYKCNIHDTIFPIVNYNKVGALGYIPHIQKFPQETDARLAQYHQNCGDLYKALDKVLGI